MTDDQEIAALFSSAMSAWGSGDARRYGSYFTDDCDYVSYDGSRASGVQPMTAAHDALFRGVLAGSSLVGEIETIRFLATDVALVHGYASVLVAWRKKVPKRRRTRTTIVALRTSEGWRIRAMNNVRIRPVRVPAPNSVPARMARGLVRGAGALHLGHADGN